MPGSTAQKLRIRENFVLLALNAPGSFKKNIEPLPDGAKILASAKNYNQVLWFVLNKVQMEKELDSALKLIKDDVVCWIYYPKGSSKTQTDMTRDKGWESFLKHDELQWISLISFDETWSTFGCRLKTEADKKKQSKLQNGQYSITLMLRKNWCACPMTLRKHSLKIKNLLRFLIRFLLPMKRNMWNGLYLRKERRQEKSA